MEVFANSKDQEGPINQIHSFICRVLCTNPVEVIVLFKLMVRFTFIYVCRFWF